MSSLDTSLVDEQSALQGCCYLGPDGRCGSREFGSNPRPQANLYSLYLRYWEAQGEEAPLDLVDFTFALREVLERAGVESEDRFCLEHGFALDTRLRAELARVVDEPEMGEWLQGAEAELVVLSRPALAPLEPLPESLQRELDELDESDLEL